jgi:hypothetical protein
MYTIPIGAWFALHPGSPVPVTRRAGAGSRDLEISTHFNFGRRTPVRRPIFARVRA